MDPSGITKFATAYDSECPDINRAIMVVVNRFVSNAARLENIKLDAPSELHSIQATDLAEFIPRMEAEGVNLLIYIDSKTKKENSSHEKLKELQKQCKSMRIQHILYKSVCKSSGSENVRKAIAASLEKMCNQGVSQV